MGKVLRHFPHILLYRSFEFYRTAIILLMSSQFRFVKNKPLCESRLSSGVLYLRSQHELHRRFPDLHTHVAIEREGGSVAFPYVESEILAADGLGIAADMIVEGCSDVATTGAFINANIIDIERLDIVEQRIVFRFDYLTEGVAGYDSFVVADKYGLRLIGQKGFELLLVVFGGVRLE